MRVYLHIGLEHVGANRLQSVLAAKREQMAAKGVLFPRAPGGKNHTRLFMAVTDPDHVDPLRFNRGFITAEKQAGLRDGLAEELTREIELHAPRTLILSASQLGASLHRQSELERLRDLLATLSDDIRIVAHVDEPARLLARHYAAQVMEGRAEPLSRELGMVEADDWQQACIDATSECDPHIGLFEETQGAPFWLDYARLTEIWEETFGAGTVALRSYRPGVFAGAEATDEIRAAFDLDMQIGKAEPDGLPQEPAAAWVARGRQLNALLLRVLSERRHIVTRQLWKSFFSDISIDGDPIDPGSLSKISARFEAANADLAARHPGLGPDTFTAPDRTEPWTEADPEMGYRASQYLLSFMYRIEKITQQQRKSKSADLARIRTTGQSHAPASKSAEVNGLSATARALMPPLAIQKFETLKSSRYAPHNRIGAVNEEELAAAYTPAPPRELPDASTGNVVVGCMKNEAPYIVEWVAYHRAIGVDNFLIYTNDCTDGTSEILDRLQDMAVLEHRNNDNWEGNSPQQHALDQSLTEPVVENADWIIHIDVDEFINVRCGNGTLQDFFDRVPDATNVAMTWRLFGHNGVTELSDEFVIDQFDTCAPKYCPKPHTAWGYKTMFRNIGAYGKISCHRPNKLADEFEDKVKWVNGSGQDMTEEAARNGWRNSRKSIGYDLLQLNHYALRSAESFLIKRQRGRALHVDRSIGLNYWIRMDWSDVRDITIKRNIPRVREEFDRLMQDDTLRGWHERALDWHRAKAHELRGMPEFEELYRQALEVKLNETERAAYALALDMES